MISKLLLLVLLILLSSTTCSENPNDLTIDCNYYWNPNSLVITPEAKSLQFYIDSSFIFSENYLDFLRSQKSRGVRLDTLITYSVDTIGLISDHLIIDILFEQSPGSHFNELGKLTLFEDEKETFKLLYIFLGYPGWYKPENSIIISSDSIDILYTKSRHYGQLTQYSERYWVYNKKSNCFNTLDIMSTVNDLAEELVPDSCRFGSGVFNIDSLFWYSYVGKEGNHYRWPSCGRIKFWLKFNGCELVVDKSIYDPEDKATP